MAASLNKEVGDYGEVVAGHEWVRQAVHVVLQVLVEARQVQNSSHLHALPLVEDVVDWEFDVGVGSEDGLLGVDSHVLQPLPQVQVR